MFVSYFVEYFCWVKKKHIYLLLITTFSFSISSFKIFSIAEIGPSFVLTLGLLVSGIFGSKLGIFSIKFGTFCNKFGLKGGGGNPL